jgi:hypothetical protein
MGVVISMLANRDTIHQWLREGRWISRARITARHSYPSEWESVFQREGRHVVLELKDGRRLTGWPLEWPNDTVAGHFVIQSPAWQNEDGSLTENPHIRMLVISADKVEWVESLHQHDATKSVKPEAIIEQPKTENE